MSSTAKYYADPSATNWHVLGVTIACCSDYATSTQLCTYSMRAATTAAHLCMYSMELQHLLTLKDLQLRGVLRQHTVKLELVRLWPVLELQRHCPIAIDPCAIVVLACSATGSQLKCALSTPTIFFYISDGLLHQCQQLLHNKLLASCTDMLTWKTANTYLQKTRLC
jgi:uncharacterized membrane protein YhhN